MVNSNRQMRDWQGGFVLIELLAIVVVIVLLAGLMLSVAGYVQKRIVTSMARAQIAEIELALATYKSDWGYYPATLSARISASGMWESLNNCILYNALCPTNLLARRKTYLHFSAGQIRTNTGTQLPNIYDGWGRPFNYYNAHTNAFTVNSGYTVGGQVNTASYDLFSYGPDGYTFIPAALPAGWSGSLWSNQNSAVDDITNWRQ